MRLPSIAAWLVYLTAVFSSGCATVHDVNAAPAPAPAIEEASVKPGINDHYFDPETRGTYIQLFEAESREIVRRRTEIVEAIGLREGMDAADIGAGTGVLTTEMASRVGSNGTVYAVDIVPAFLDRIRQRVQEAGLDNVVVVLGEERATGLEAASIDVALMCNTYHHIEYPRTYLRSVFRTLRPGGAFVVIDTNRAEGGNPAVLEHVRADKRTVIAEIEQAGFVLESELELLVEDYYIRFSRP